MSSSSEAGLVRARAEAAPKIANLTRAIASKRLWHRATTDGAVMINTNSGWLVSQTKTDKTGLGPIDFSLMIDSNSEKNTITYAGYKLPSSDAPEYAELIKSYAEAGMDMPNMIVHFHHSTLTRSGEFPENTTAEELEYGVFDSGKTIFEELQKRGANWLVLKNHGFLWLGNSTEEFDEFLELISSKRIL